MNIFFAASLFDNPWVVALIVIGGALANWLAKRRQEKQAEHPSEGEESSPSSGKPPGPLSFEETLRRLMGEEPPAPPPLPRAAPGEVTPLPDWQEEELFQPVSQAVPPLRPPLIAVAQASAASEQQVEAARRFEQLNEQGRHPATVVGHPHGDRSRAARRPTSRWRDPGTARQAFVASIVLAPPKSLEA